MGELGILYWLSPIVFVGGSLIEHGGQNPIEAVKLGACVLHGPHIGNFAEVYAALDAARGAIEVGDPEELAATVARLLRDGGARKALIDSGQKTVSRLSGALDRTLAAIEPYLMQLRLEHHLTDA